MKTQDEERPPSSKLANDAIDNVEGVAARLRALVDDGSLDESSAATVSACATALDQAVNAIGGYWDSDIGSIVHTHSRNASAFAQAGIGIPCYGTTHADYFFGEVPVTRRMTEAEIKSNYELETANVIIERFKDLAPQNICAVLVHGHGPFAWGSNGKKAVENALALEIVAEMALKTIQLNSSPRPIDQRLLEKHFLRKHGPKAYYGQK